MEYIKELRKIVGHRPLIVPVCGCLIFNDKGQVLLQKRSDDNLWGNPGGSVEFGETIYDAVKREVLEETNLEINDLELFNIYSGEEQHHVYPNGDEIYYINIIFKTNSYKGNLKIDKESEKLKFFDLTNLPDNLTKPFMSVARDLKRLQ